jgi:hypothetical protein
MVRLSSQTQQALLGLTGAVLALLSDAATVSAQSQTYTNGSAIYFMDNSGTLTRSMFVFGDPLNRLNLGTGNATQMTITPAGNIGIGTTSPQDRLELAAGNQIIRNGGAIYFRDQNGSMANSMFVFGDPLNRLNLGTGNATRMVITTSGNIGIGTTAPAAMFHVAGNVQVDGNIAAKYQDVAEWVKARHKPAPGTVVVIDPSAPNSVITASKAYDTSVAGVVSERPGLLLGEEAADSVKVAHSGRVKVKVDAQYGPIAIGDLIVTSPTAGFGMRSTPVDLGGTPVHRPGTLMGKALESLSEGEGEILVLLMLQ